MTRFVAFALTTVAFVGAPLYAGDPPRPNIVLIIADDLGWNDVGWHGSEIKTPNLDKLAKNGVRLERHYVYPTCSPTRAGILTGRNPSRFNIHAPIAGKSEQALPFETLTLARLLQTRGYYTGLIGKWHLGLRPEVGPRRLASISLTATSMASSIRTRIAITAARKRGIVMTNTLRRRCYRFDRG